MKDLIIADFAKAWKCLDPELIIQHLSRSFIYHSQWVSEILDYEGYKEYLRCKFKVLQQQHTVPQVKIVNDNLWGGKMLSLSTPSTTAYYRIMTDGENVYLGWLFRN